MTTRISVLCTGETDVYYGRENVLVLKNILFSKYSSKHYLPFCKEVPRIGTISYTCDSLERWLLHFSGLGWARRLFWQASVILTRRDISKSR